jgi:hypothetical protein
MNRYLGQSDADFDIITLFVGGEWKCNKLAGVLRGINATKKHGAGVIVIGVEK